MLAYRNVREGAIADVGSAIAMACGGALAFAPTEYALTLATYSGASSAGSKLRLLALTATLSLVLWFVLAVVFAALLVTVRLVRAQIAPVRGRQRGFLAPLPAEGGVRPGVPRVWAAVITALLVGLLVQRAAAWAIATYKEPQLTAALIAAVAIGAMALAVVLDRAFTFSARAAAAALAPVLRSLNPLGRWRAAGVALAGLTAGVLAACWYLVPQSRSILPVRLIASAITIALGAGMGRYVRPVTEPRAPMRAAIGALIAVALLGILVLLPSATWAAPVWIAAGVGVVLAGLDAGAHVPRHRPRRLALPLAALALVLATLTLTTWGADLETKYIAITASPALDKLIGVVRTANDLDRDGFGSLLGEGDCAPFDKAIHPGAIDRPDDGIDQNCDGHDFSMSAIVTPSGPNLPVPASFRKDWNVLLITIDTLRYDHTTFGGYADSPKHRDTTPRLQELVKRSTSFTFTNAPSAGTMASIPAILTSKYFHSGIALDESVPKGAPPRIKPENTTLPEIMKRGGYRTGVIGSHVWWNDWGLDQGVDDYDNSIAKTDDPFRVAADKVTDHALAWISRQQGKKWFLWAHYIDPHGRYVAHPDVVDYGTSEPDLYDSEIKWTDQQLGRLFDELVRLPSNENTIIIITSDHGDSMAEHNVPLGTHGTALYRELQHVPMIFYIPDNTPRLIGGAVTNLDIVPTIAELTNIDVHDLTFEGRSLVGALFYGKEDHDRIVFAETNAPNKQRAAISEAWKLIYYLNTNVYELFDLKADPWEHQNLAPSNPPALAMMKQALQGWMDRVLYARDANFNQAFRQMSDVLSNEPPAVATTGQTLASGAIEVVGIGPATVHADKNDFHVYFRTAAPTDQSYKFQLVVWPVTPPSPAPPAGSAASIPAPVGVPSTAIRSNLRFTADGAFPTEHWRAGDRVRERFSLTLPADWHGDVVVGLIAQDSHGAKAHWTGETVPGDPTIAILGHLGSSRP